jgi:hypothetical protein
MAEMDSASTLVDATRSRRRQRALTEAEAYFRCHGRRALRPVPVGAPEKERELRAALLRALPELRV